MLKLHLSVITVTSNVSEKQEVDRIIAQMMHAADYLGWDVSELRPVSYVCVCVIFPEMT